MTTNSVERSWPKFLIVLRKELREAFRDRRALGMIGLIVILYPAILWGSINNIIDRSTKADREGIELVVTGAAQVPTLISLLEQRNITVSMRAEMSEGDITDLLRLRKYVAVLQVPEKFSEQYNSMRPARVELWHDSAADQQAKLRRLESVLRSYNASIAGARLLAHGVSPTTLSPIQLQEYDTANSASRSASFVGALLGMFFAAAFFFCLNTAMDSTAGERERRSLEMLLAQPASPLDLIGGKWLATATLAIIGLTLELLAAHFILKWMPLEEIGMSWRMSLPLLLTVCLTSVPLCLFAAAFEIALAMNARSFKEAQTMMGVAVLIPMLPAIIVPMMDLNTALWMYLVPVLANQTLLRELAKGQDIGLLPFVLTATSALLASFAAVAFATWRLKSERYVLGV
ncbi:ABC transporter permease [soil metagenome]